MIGKKFEFHDVEQNSEEWFSLRCGKLTGSKWSVIMAYFEKPLTERADEFAFKLALERVTGKYIKSNEFIKDAKRGHENEPIAIKLYEEEMFCQVENGGFFCNGILGDSPDGVIKNSKNTVEVKTVRFNTMRKLLKKGGIIGAYKYQIQSHIFSSGGDWCDFIVFCPEYPKGKQLYIKRVYKDLKLQSVMKKRLEQFLLLVNVYESNLRN